MTAGPATDRGRRGFALLLVLWALVLVSLIVSQLSATSRREARIAANLANSAKAESMADGAVYEAVVRLLDASAKRWPIDGKARRLQFDDGEALVRVQSEAGKVNPNTAPPALLQALLERVGVERGLAERLSVAIVRWREDDDSQPKARIYADYAAAGLDYGPPGESLESIDELGRVLGMTPPILAALRPHLSLYQQGLPDPALADPIVLAAIQTLPPDDDSEHGPAGGLQVVTITADARLGNGARFVRQAIVKLGSTFERGYSIDQWESAQAP